MTSASREDLPDSRIIETKKLNAICARTARQVTYPFGSGQSQEKIMWEAL